MKHHRDKLLLRVYHNFLQAQTCSHSQQYIIGSIEILITFEYLIEHIYEINYVMIKLNDVTNRTERYFTLHLDIKSMKIFRITF